MRRPAPGVNGAGRLQLSAWLSKGMEQPEENRDYYRVLGVSPSADQETIGRAYRRLMKSVHPDARRGRSDPDTGRRVAELVEAWRVLGDPSRRSAYDSVHLPGEAEPSAPRGEYHPAHMEPVLEIQPRTLELGRVQRGDAATGLVRLHSRGGPATAVERLDTAPSWLSVSRSEPRRAAITFPVAMSVQVDTCKLEPRRRHQTELVFRLAAPSQGLRSLEQRVTVSLTVAPKQPPRLKAQPGGWVVAPCQCQGAPHSLLLHLFLANEGGGSVTGTVRGDPWMRIAPRQFGPLGGGTAPVHVAIELDCDAWAASGWRDGRVLVATEEGDLLEVALVAGDALAERPTASGPSRLPRQLLTGVASAMPALALLAELWQLALVAALLVGAALPPLVRSLGHQEVLSRGPAEEATPWAVGPRGGGLRLWLLLLAWATLGALLGVTSGRWATGGMPASTVVWGGAVAGGVALLSVSAGNGKLPVPFGGANGGGQLRLGILGVVAGGAWTVLGLLLAQAVVGSSGAAAGAAAGWLVGCAVALARNPDLRSEERRGMAGLLWGIVPVASSVAGFAVALTAAIDWGLGTRRVASLLLGGSTGAGTSPLMALPPASLASSLMALAAGAGLLLGFGLGLAAVLPIIDVVVPDAPGGWRRRGLGLVRAVGAEMVFRHAGVDDLPWLTLTAEGAERPSLCRTLLEIHWSTLVVGTGAGLLLIYAAAHLLLALTAAVGALVG